MTRQNRAVVREDLALATGPTIEATHDQTCGWCLGDVAAKERVTYTRESGWCHASCTSREVGATRQ